MVKMVIKTYGTALWWCPGVSNTKMGRLLGLTQVFLGGNISHDCTKLVREGDLLTKNSKGCSRATRWVSWVLVARRLKKCSDCLAGGVQTFVE